MKKYLLFIIVIGLVAFGTSCASKRYAKKGVKYEMAGMYEMAAQSYLRSLQANPNNIDARVGLKKNGQRLLDQKVLAVHGAYDASDDKKTVYSYLDAKGYQDQVASFGVELIMPERTPDLFKDAKAKYLEKIYSEAQLLLEDEKFKQSEDLLAEVNRLEPGYGNSDELMKVSKSEPLYRQGRESLNTGMYRKSYASFDQIIRTQGAYKDSKELRDEALAKGMVTISFNRIENKTNYENLQVIIESKVKASLSNLKNPFVRVLDNQNTNQLIQEQQRGLTQGSDIQIGKILAAKAIFSGSLLTFRITEGKLVKQDKRGFTKEEYTVKDPVTGESKKSYKYLKTTYTEYQQENKITSSFQYQLTSTESSAIMVSDAMEVNASDNIHYIVFEGNGKNLVPGYWERIDKDSPKDKVNDSPADVASLRDLLKTGRSIKSVETLKTELLDGIAERVAKKIASYNPEE
jgi:tetratricopeptide (TPR) repeat protein